MERKVLIAIIAVVVVLILVGGAVAFMLGGKNIGSQKTTTFDIQGMRVEILQPGTGEGAKAEDYVTVHYSGTLTDGTEYDSSIKRNTPFTFQLGQNRVIQGWDLGLVGAKVGEKRRLTIPFELGYGADGFPPTIPQKATLIYTIDIMGLNNIPQ